MKTVGDILRDGKQEDTYYQCGYYDGYREGYMKALEATGVILAMTLRPPAPIIITHGDALPESPTGDKIEKV